LESRACTREAQPGPALCLSVCLSCLSCLSASGYRGRVDPRGITHHTIAAVERGVDILGLLHTAYRTSSTLDSFTRTHTRTPQHRVSPRWSGSRDLHELGIVHFFYIYQLYECGVEKKKEKKKNRCFNCFALDQLQSFSYIN
jgi:hypothetical protein